MIKFVEIETKKETLLFGFLSQKPTSVFGVLSANGAYLGKIRWHEPWDQYVFEPDPGAVIFGQDCLAELSVFIKNLMDKRRREAEP